MDFFDAVQNRRSYYAIGQDSPIPDKRIAELVTHAVEYAPSAFDSRSSRVLLLLEEGHARLWDIVLEALRRKVPTDRFGETEQKLEAFAAGHGTVLFYEDQEIVRGLQAHYPTYRDSFPVWSEQSSGMLQYVIWTGLEAEGLGASLQHYNPLIDSDVSDAFQIPDTWKLIAQMPFGTPLAQPDSRAPEDPCDRIRIVK